MAGTGCFLLWKNYSPLLTGKIQSAEVADIEAELDDPAHAETPDDEEPLAALANGDDEEIEARPIGQREIREIAASDDDFPVADDLFDDELADRPAPSASPVRRAAATAERLPVTPRPNRAVSQPSRSDFDELADGGEFENTEPTDESDDVGPMDSGETELVEVDTPPRRPTGGSRFTSARPAETVESDEFETDLDDGTAISESAPEPTRLRPVDADDDVPNLRISDARNRVALDGPDVELAVPRTQGKSAAVPANFDQPQIVEDLESDSVNGLEAVDLSSRRALSRTRVLRPTEVPDEMIAESESGDETLSPAREGLSREPERTPITPRRAQPVAPGDQPSSRVAFQEPRPRHRHESGESYVVEPSDTYWSISKKIYGTPRFFQALAEHNRAQVAEPERLRPGVKISTPPEEDLLTQYARYVPGSGNAEKSGNLVPGDRSVSEKLGIASESPTRRVPGREPRSIAEAGDHGAHGGGFHYSRSGEPLYQVGDGDTLSTIAQQHLGKSSRSNELYQLNQDRLADPDRLRVGTVLRLPADASRIGLVPRSERIR